MWIIQGQALLSIPDDAPLPPGSVRTEPPDDFREDPTRYRIEGGRIVRSEEAAKRPRAAAAKLTPDEIARLKKALKEGGL